MSTTAELPAPIVQNVSTPLRLNIGGGEKHIEGFVQVDRKGGGEAFPLSYYGKPVDDDSVDEIRASHVLEHFSHRDTFKVLKEWVRVLKPGGLMRLAVPNFEWIAKAYLSGAQAPLVGYTMGGHVDNDDKHGAVFDDTSLFNLMEKAGLTDIEPWESDKNDCASLPVSLNLMGRKAVVKKLSVECAMSVPRLGFMSNFFCWAENLLIPFDIRPTSYDGAFWGQCLERVMEKLTERENPPDYVLAVDYDSFFDQDTVRRLLLTACNHPEADAISCIQVKRGDEQVPLLSVRGEDGKGQTRISASTFTPWLTRAHSAHFGLTLLKVEALMKMPHPWFMGQPDANGRWHDNRVDDDIYFWNKWAETGNSLYVANRCTIGHGEYVVLWPDRDFKTIHQPTSTFRNDGMPKGVWR